MAQKDAKELQKDINKPDETRPPEEKPRFPAAAPQDGGLPDTLPGKRPVTAGIRTPAEEAEAARLSREAADDPVGPQGRSILACFDPPAVAKALKISTGDAERLIDTVVVRLGKGSAQDRARDLVEAIGEVAHGKSVDEVLNARG